MGVGELLAVVGPSRSGWTILLRLIAGLEMPTHGVLRIGDRIVNNMPPHHRYGAMVFQRLALYSHLSDFNNIAFGLKLRRQTWWSRLSRSKGSETIRTDVLEIAQLRRLSDVLLRRLATLT